MVGRRCLPLSSGRRLRSRSEQPSLAEVARQEAERRKSTKDHARRSSRPRTCPSPPASSRRPRRPRRCVGAASGASAGRAQDRRSGAAAGQGRPPVECRRREGGSQPGAAASRRRARALRRNEAFAEALQTPRQRADDRLRQSRQSHPADTGRRGSREGARRDWSASKATSSSRKKQIVDIEEEARKAGVPPGWLR